MSKEITTDRIAWHQFLGAVLGHLLRPVGITVHVEFPVASEPPISDVVLLRPGSKNWTEEQIARLPDGIRDDPAGDVLLELKYTESVNHLAIGQAMLLYELYCRSHKASRKKTRIYLVSSKRTNKKLLNKYGYLPTQWPGVFHSNNPCLLNVRFISLNDLANTPHNAFFKCFASQIKEKANAFSLLKKIDFIHNSSQLTWLLNALALLWFEEEGAQMNIPELTPEKATEMGKRWGDFILDLLPPEEVLAHFRPEDRLQGLRPEERLQGLSVEDIENYLTTLKSRPKPNAL